EPAGRRRPYGFAVSVFRHYINGAFVDSADGAALPVYEPATGAEYAQVADGSRTEVDAAVDAARAAFPAWAALGAEARAALLNRIADGIDARGAEFAAAESRDTGKPVWLAGQMDIARASSNCRFFAAAALQFASEAHLTPGTVNYTRRDPHGVVGCITPWNLP